MRRMPYWRFLCACLAHACNGTSPAASAIDALCSEAKEVFSYPTVTR